MAAQHRLPVFEKFIEDLRSAWDELTDTEARRKRGAELLERLVRETKACAKQQRAGRPPKVLRTFLTHSAPFKSFN
jgi:hypothetical protein